MSDVPTRVATQRITGLRRQASKRQKALKALLVESVDEGDIERIIRGLLDKAANGDVPAAKLILDRVLGPADAITEDDEQSDSVESLRSAFTRPEGKALLRQLIGGNPVVADAFREALQEADHLSEDDQGGEDDGPDD